MKIDFIAEYNKVKDPVIRQSLIDNYGPEYVKNKRRFILGLDNNKLEYCIYFGFDWEKSPQGEDYWEDIQRQAFDRTLELIDGVEY